METVTEILIDFSGSMKEKMALTKSTLLKIVIPKLDFSAKIGVKTFSSLGIKLIINQVLPLNLVNLEQLSNTVNLLGIPEGGTPLAMAIRESVITLSEFSANDKMLVVVTDGEETEGGNPEIEIQNAKSKGIDLQIHFIVIGQNDKTRLLAESLNKITNCSFSSIPFVQGSTTYNESTIKTHLANFFNSISDRPFIQTPPIINQQSIQIQNVDPSNNLKVEDETKEVLSLLEYAPADFQRIFDNLEEIKQQIKELKREKTEVPDYDEDQIINEQISKKSEEYLFCLLKKKYPERVNWLNEEGENYADHDFEIFDQTDKSIEYFIECKGAAQNRRTFFLTKKEWWLFLNHTKNYQIYFVRNAFGNPSHIFIDNLLDWVLKGKIVPLLLERAVVKEDRVYLTISESIFVNNF